MMIRNLLGLFSLLSLGALAGCAGNAGDANGAASSDEADSLSSTSTYFIVTHVDARRCVSPICGGVFVKRLNFATTKCADGVYRNECHALTTDYSALGLDEAESAKVDSTFAEGHVLVRGSLKTTTVHGLAADTLVATEAWVGNALSTPTGTFYAVHDNGRKCFTAPCDNVHEAKLDSTTQREVAGVDLTTAGANSKQVAAAEAALANGIIIVAGDNKAVSGPGGHSLELVAREFYTRIVHTPTGAGQGEACGGLRGLTCADNMYCDVSLQNACNGADLMGTCKVVPQICYQLVMPVCGCDGKTYGNDCFRLSAQVQLAHTGACN